MVYSESNGHMIDDVTVTRCGGRCYKRLTYIAVNDCFFFKFTVVLSEELRGETVVEIGQHLPKLL